MASLERPLVVYFNCMEDCAGDAEALADVAELEHVSLAEVLGGRLELAAVVVVQSLSFLPRAAQKRLSPAQMVVCMGAADRAAETQLAEELGLQLLHVDKCRTDEIADTVMALALGLLRKTHVLAGQGPTSGAWLGGLPVGWAGMRRLRGLTFGLIGSNAAARAVARRAAGFGLRLVYCDTDEVNEDELLRPRRRVPRGRRLRSVADVLSACDVLSLHCSLTNETLHLINEDALQHAKPGGVILINVASYHLLKDSAVKAALNSGVISACALTGVEGSAWLEAWVRELPNVLLLPPSAEHSEEVWAEMRAKLVHVLRVHLAGTPAGSLLEDAVSDDDIAEADMLLQEQRELELEGQLASHEGSTGEEELGDLGFENEEEEEPLGARHVSHLVPAHQPGGKVAEPPTGAKPAGQYRRSSSSGLISSGLLDVSLLEGEEEVERQAPMGEASVSFSTRAEPEYESIGDDLGGSFREPLWIGDEPQPAFLLDPDDAFVAQMSGRHLAAAPLAATPRVYASRIAFHQGLDTGPLGGGETPPHSARNGDAMESTRGVFDWSLEKSEPFGAQPQSDLIGLPPSPTQRAGHKAVLLDLASVDHFDEVT